MAKLVFYYRVRELAKELDRCQFRAEMAYENGSSQKP
jgi:hypothetical protein